MSKLGNSASVDATQAKKTLQSSEFRGQGSVHDHPRLNVKPFVSAETLKP